MRYLESLCPLLLLCLAACGDADPSESGQPGEATQPTIEIPAYGAVILVTIDTLRADHVGYNGYLRETTPFIDGLAERGVVFDRAHATMSFTGPSHSSMLTGLHPFQHKVLANGQHLDPAIPNMAQIFRDHGYKTAAFLSTKFLKNVAESFEEVHVGSRAGPASLENALKWVQGVQDGAPFFLWLHLFDVHDWDVDKTPAGRTLARDLARPLGEDDWYDYLADRHGWPRVGADGEFPAFIWDTAGQVVESRERLLDSVDSYDARLRYVDECIERLFNQVKEKLVGSPVLWVVTSDHGEGLGSHSFKGHTSAIYQEQLHVPLVVYQEPELTARQIGAVVSLVDLLPTMAEALDHNLEPTEGVSLWPLMRGQPRLQPYQAFAQRAPSDDVGDVFALISEGHKYVFRTDLEDGFYDLGRDPMELASDLEGESATELRQILQAKLQAMNWEASAQDTDISDLPEGILNQLKALGYVK